jgi:hypothetical protein
MGGTEKGLVTHAVRMDRRRWDVRVVGALGLGPRQSQLAAAGIPVDTAEGDGARLARLLEGADVVLVFRSGITEPLVPAAAREAGVPVLVEWNIFGHVDHSADERQFACHLFISKFLLMRYGRRLGGVGGDFHKRHRAAYLGLELDTLRGRAPSHRTAKAALGLDPDRPVAGRIGRAADFKWRNLLVDMVPPLLRQVPEAQLLFVGATPAKERRLKRLGVLGSCRLEEPTMNDERLSTYYAACDVLVAAAEIGESQGLALAEAMSLGVPVVTCSTPWVDNAQVELVDHGRTGYVANHPRPFAAAVADLLRAEERRRSFGEQARKKVEMLLEPGKLTRQLEGLFDALVAGEPPPYEWTPSSAEVDRFYEEYERRVRAEYAPLTAREQAHMRLVRSGERWRQRASHINREGLSIVWDQARARLRPSG